MMKTLMKKFNVYYGASAGAITLAVIVILAELVKSFKELLKAIFWHHWVGKLVLMVLAFFIAGYLYRNKQSMADERIAWYSVLISLAVILLFYIIHYFI